MTKTYVGDSAYSIAELARLAHTDTGTMSQKVKRLEALGSLVRTVMSAFGADCTVEPMWTSATDTCSWTE